MESWNLNLQQLPQQPSFPSFSDSSPTKPSRKARYQQKKKENTVTAKTTENQRIKRKKCPAKEKERNEAINSGFETLQSRIKCIKNAEKSSKIPKVKVLRIAIRYINYLKKKLETPDEFYNPSMDDFVLQAMDVIQTKNCYTKRAAQEIDSGSSISSPQEPDAGYISPPESFTPPSNYSSDYFEVPSSQTSSIDSSSSFSLPLNPTTTTSSSSLNNNFYSNFPFPNYVPQQFQMMDYENYPTTPWKHGY